MEQDAKPTFCLRAASQDDFDCLFDLRIAAMRESLERIGRFDERRAFERFRSSFRPEHTQLIFVNDTLAGCVAMKPAENGLLLEHFYLHPAFQSRGLGNAILTQLLAVADAANQPLRLSVLQKSDAGRFYKRYGFIETAQDEWDVYLERPSRDVMRRKFL